MKNVFTTSVSEMHKVSNKRSVFHNWAIFQFQTCVKQIVMCAEHWVESQAGFLHIDFYSSNTAVFYISLWNWSHIPSVNLKKVLQK